MDPNTTVVMLATNLICSAGLFYLINRRMPGRGGAGYWSAGSMTFGLSQVGQLAVGTSSPWAAVGLVLDTSMVVASGMFLVGLRQWVGKAASRPVALLALAAAYALVQLAVVSLWASAGRFALLNLTLASVYGLNAAEALRARRFEAAPLRAPLLLFVALMGTLALLTAARGVRIGVEGTGSMNSGLHAQIFYGFASLSVVLLGMNLMWMAFVQMNCELQELASRDALTRVLNRNGLDDALARHFSARDAGAVTFLEVDVDHFKRVNDAFGHATGDAVLRAVADSLSKRVRGNDFVARVGGEEFMVGCVGGDRDMALNLGERLRAGVAEMRVASAEGRAQVSCTVSVGISRSFHSLGERDQAAREADRALYAAKSAGRNRVVAFELAAA
jgi:diguanylate cyclase (GGDEF)-like protein